MIFRVDEDRVVRTSSHAGLAANANRFIEIDDAVRTLEHRGRGTSCDTGRVRALIAARYLMCAAHLWEHAHVDVLDVGAGDANRHHVFGLAGRRARVTTDAAGVVGYLRPLDGILASWFWLDHKL